MKRTLLPTFILFVLPFRQCRRFFILSLLVFILSPGVSNAITYYSRASANWNVNSTWSTVSFVSMVNAGTFPVAGDIVNIGGGFTVTIGAAAACTTLNIGNTGTLTLGGFALTVSGTTTVGGGTSGIMNTATSGAGTKTFTGAVTVNAGAQWNLSGQNPATSFGGGITMNGTTFNNGSGATAFSATQSLLGTSAMTFGGTVTIAGGSTVTNSNTNTVTVSNTGSIVLTGNFTQGVNSTLALAAAAPFSGAGTFNATTNANTVNYTGAAQTVRAVVYRTLGLSGSGAKTMTGVTTIGTDFNMSGSATATPVITTVGGNISITGTAVMTTGANNAVTGSLTVGTGATLSLGGFSLSIGTTSNITGTVNTVTSSAGTKTFTGAVTVNAGGVWNLSGQNPSTSFGGGITMNGTTFNNGSGATAFSATQSLLGSSAMTFGGIVTISAGTLTNSNTNTVTLSNAGVALVGAGTFTQGTTGNTLSYAGTNISVTNFNATGANNTVTYTGASPAIFATTYNNLTVNGSGAATVGSATTVNGTMTVSSAVTNNSLLTVTTALSGTSTLTQGVGSTLNVGGTSGINGLDANTNANTVNYTGAAQTVKAVVYRTLGLSGSGAKSMAGVTTIGTDFNMSGSATATPVITTVGGNVSITGTAVMTTGANNVVTGSLTVGTGATLSLGGVSLGIGTTSNITGTVNTVTAAMGTKTFTGAVTVNAGGVWNLSGQNPATSFGGGITMNGTTFNNGSGATAFTANQSLLGSSAMTFGGIVTISAGTTLTNSNTNTVTLSNTGVALAVGGAGSTFTQGTTGNTLSYAGSSIGVTNFNATGAGNTVIYSAVNQTARVTTYNNLTLAGSGVKTFATTPTVNGVLSMEGTATVTVTGAGVVTYGPNATLQYNTPTPRTASTEEWITPFLATGGVIIANTGVITSPGALQMGNNTNVPLNIQSGASLTAGTLITLHGNFIRAGTFTSSVGVTLAGTTATQSIAGFTTSGNVSMTKTSGVATFQGDVSGGNLTINGAGGTLNLGTGLTHNFTGTWTRTNGTLNGGSSTLRIGGNVSGTGGTFTGSTGTVEWFAAGIQTLASGGSVSYYNLILSGSGNKTFTAATTISENLSISGTAIANLGTGFTHAAKTLTLGGASQPSGSHGSTGSIATYQNDTYFLSPFNGILNIACSVTTSGTPTTYYSRNTTSGGNWNDNNSWTTSADGTGGPLAAGVWPRIFDNVVIRSGHTITIDAIDDNEFCGVTPDGLGRSNVGPFAASNVLMFYQTGDLQIAGTLSVSVEIMIENYTHVTSSGNFSSSTSLVNLGNLEVDNGATFSTLDDLILAGTSTTIVNTNSIAADDLIISFTSATLCGTGATTLQNGAGSVITYANGATAAQICSTYTVACTGGGCAGTFPVAGTGTILLGNTGPGGVGNNTNNRLWLRANDLSLANGAAVDSWSDVSGNGLTASNGTAGERPTFATNSANGFPSLSFDGTDDNLSLGAPAVLNFVPQTDSWSFIIAYQAPTNGISTTPNQGTLFSKAWSANRNYQYQIDDINVTTSVLASYIGNTLNSGTVQVNTNAWVISSHTNTTTTKSSFSNEASNFSGIAIAAGADAATDVLIGARRNTGPADGSEGFLFTGNIAEIMMYNSVLNTAQRIIIADYLAAKYAVTLSANDFYTMDDVGNGNFDSEVAGIGQASDGSNHKDAMGSGVVRMWNASNLDNDEFLLWGHDNTTFYSSTTTGVGAPIQERLSRTWRVSESGGDVGTVSVSFDISLLATPLGSNLRLLIDRDNDGFADNDVTPVAGTFVDDVVVFSGVNFQDGDRFTLGNTDVTNPLPIELINFSAKLNNDIVELEWSTASELNNDFFTIERAIDLERFEEVVSIKGSGTTKEKHNYKTTDSNPLYGRSYYRLKQTDFDGKFAYSDLRVIDYEGPQFSTLRVYPNPNNGQSMTLEVIGLKDQSTVPVQIYNVQGQKVFDHTFEVNTPGTLKYDLEFGSPLRSGLYIIKAGQTLQLTQKIIVD